jgi:hypothetical protein
MIVGGGIPSAHDLFFGVGEARAGSCPERRRRDPNADRPRAGACPAPRRGRDYIFIGWTHICRLQIVDNLSSGLNVANFECSDISID